MTGYEKAKAKADELAAEKAKRDAAQKADQDTTALRTMNSSSQSVSVNSYDSLGLQGIDAEDIKPPTMLLVQGIRDKSELTDINGVECPDGKFFLKGINEIVSEAEVCFLLIRKDHFHKDEYSSSDEQRWEGSRMYKAIAVRLSDMQPFSIDFKKSSLSALGDLLTVVTAQKKPVYLYKTLLRVAPAVNKSGKPYSKAIVNLKGLLTDEEKLPLVRDMYQQFNMRADEVLVDDEISDITPEQPATPIVEETPMPEKEVTQVEDVSDDIPF